MSTASHTPAPPPQHPALEILAAFVDGRLREDERRRTVAHLAGCELCREVVAETVHLSEDPALADAADPADGDSDEDDEPAPSPGRVLRPPLGRFRGTLPLVGALVAAGLAALLTWTVASRVFLSHDLVPTAVSDLTATMDKSALRQGIGDVPTAPNVLDFPYTRGGGGEELPMDLSPPGSQTPQQAFRLGFHLALLDAAVRAGAPEVAEDVIQWIDYQKDLEPPSLEGVKFTLDRARSYIGDLPASGENTSELLGSLDALLDGTLDDDGPLLDYPQWYELGKWTGAAWTAAHTGDLGWFDDAETKQRLHALRQQEWGGATDPALASVTGLAVSDPEEADLPALKAALHRLTGAAGGKADAMVPGFAPPPVPDALPDSADPTDPTKTPTPHGDAP